MHPLARDQRERPADGGITAGEVDDFVALPANGLSGIYEGSELCGGNANFIGSVAAVSDEIAQKQKNIRGAG